MLEGERSLLFLGGSDELMPQEVWSKVSADSL
jgi:hypothetical protein